MRQMQFSERYRGVAALAALLMVGACGCHTGNRVRFTELVDLTHPFDENTVYWPTAQSFHLTQDFKGITERGYYYTANTFCGAEHGGTHIDAPVHFHAAGHTVDTIPLTQLIGPAVVVDVTAQCAADRDYQVQTQDFLDWERRHGQRLDDAVVLLRTGFGKFYPHREQYMGTEARGAEAVTDLHFPGLHPEAAAWLAAQRSIRAIGLDTPSIDYGQSTHFESHVALFEHNVAVFENLANLEQMPASGFEIIALPMKIRGGSGGPLRIIALL